MLAEWAVKALVCVVAVPDPVQMREEHLGAARAVVRSARVNGEVVRRLFAASPESLEMSLSSREKRLFYYLARTRIVLSEMLKP